MDRSKIVSRPASVSLAPFYARARRRRIWRRLRWPLFIGGLGIALVVLALVLNWHRF